MKVFIILAVLILCLSCGTIYINKDKCQDLGGPILKCERSAKIN